jgi:23S rRNA pseudouridine2605 synthase
LRRSEREDGRPLRPEKPPGRPRRGHAWRKDDAPLRRTYRGSRRDDLTIADEARPDKRAGLMTDRKGRCILVERFGTKKEKPQPAETPAHERPPRRRSPPDRASGPRPSRPRLSDERLVEAGSEKPRKFGSRPEGSRRGGFEKSSPRPPGPRTSRPRPSGPRPPRTR